MNTNLPSSDAVGTYFTVQTNQPPLPYPQFADLPVYLLDPTNHVYVVDDRSVDYNGLFAECGSDYGSSGGFSMSMPPVFFSPSLPACGSGGPVYITNFSAVMASNHTMTVSFEISGGSSNTIYDILIATNIAGTNVEWFWLGQGVPCDSYTFYNQLPNQAFYALGIPTPTMVVAWGDNLNGQCNVPAGLTNVVEVTGGEEFSLALKSDGTVVAWGDNTYGQTNVPSGLSNVVNIAAGAFQCLALKADGTVSAWGEWEDNISNAFHSVSVPTNLASVVGIAAGLDHDLALLANGTVVAWGYTNELYNSVPTNLSNAIAIAAGWDHNVTLSQNGSAATWGYDYSSLNYNLTDIPSDLTNANAAIAIAVCSLHSVALRTDGTVESWGYDLSGETNVPAGLSNVVSITAGDAYSMALKNDGTIEYWGGFTGPTVIQPQGLSNGIVAIGSGGSHILALRVGQYTPIILEEPVGQILTNGQATTLTAIAEGYGSLTYQWQLNGTNIAGATNSTLVLSDLQTDQFGNYDVVVSDSAGSITSSIALIGPLEPPEILSIAPAPYTNWFFTNVSPGFSISATDADTAEYPIYYQWKLNGTNIAGATNYSYFPNLTGIQTVPASFSVTVSNVAGYTNIGNWNIRYALPGMIAAWGDDEYGEIDNPPLLTNFTGIYTGDVMAMATGDYHGIALLENGTVYEWGKYTANFSTFTSVPSTTTNTNLVAVAATLGHDLGLTASGTVVSWGLSDDIANYVPTNLSGVTAIAAAWNHNVALLTNGTVTAWGYDGEELGWNLTDVPASATNVTAISAQALHSLALRSDGTVIAWGNNEEGETNVPAGLSNVVAIAAGGYHNLALKADGTIVAWGLNNYGQTNVPAGLSNVMAIAAGLEHSMALKNDGTVIAWGSGGAGQTNVIPGLANVKLISACGNFSFASIFSPVVQYPVDMSKDLLLIYNTNSVDSYTVMSYYLAHRPMVSNANVLGIGFQGFPFTNAVTFDSSGYHTNNVTNYETISPGDFTNEILAPVNSWLATNPTKRPAYVILFLDIPSRVNSTATNAGNSPFYYGNCGDCLPPVTSVGMSYQLTTDIPEWHPFITHLNMNGTNDCLAYISKIQSFSSNSPYKLFVSATAGGYSNTTYCLDDGTNGSAGSRGGDASLSVVQTLTNEGVASTDIYYGPSITNIIDITQATNVTAYWSKGTHGHVANFYWPLDGSEMEFSGDSSWYIMTTFESFNGFRYIAPSPTSQSTFLMWFDPNAFGNTNYLNTPVGAVCHVDEPFGSVNLQAYYGLWAAGKSFAISAWNSRLGSQNVRETWTFQAVGDPFVTK